MRRLVIAAPHSGSGKTTVTALLCLALRGRGLTVQPYKFGPDYLDPTHLSRAAGRQARNLDTFLLSQTRMKALFQRSAAGADFALIEGVMGLYDGRDPHSDEHSTADLASQLDAPVVLVIDAGGMARTVAALAAGLRDFRPGLRVAGVILNRVGGARHAELCEVALTQVGLPVLGHVSRDAHLELPARHLGLLSAEQAHWDEAAALSAVAHLRLDDLWEAAGVSPSGDEGHVSTPALTFPTSRVRIAYALDEAFHFYYPDALDELRLAGAELVPFSPLRDAGLPPGSSGLLLGGGYPEVHAAGLSANVAMRQSVRAFADAGFPVVAECGGLMYLAEHLETEGETWPMCGVVPYRTRMASSLTLGYRDAQVLQESPLCPAGAGVRGHEFHYSHLTHPPTHPAYQFAGRGGEEVTEGYARGNVLASYLHLHYAADPAMARRLVQRCAEAAR
ncbi:cobyrinate a,c-diamide synthase [Deinococcus sp. HMF7604]|uniref:cobyrinate a,c-diamide synthase n=1 Tax=Deinococcus betulae TaxID=2873312 RepID=UPI001CCE01BC|nr:cobyrinate a,c-diamide synthase [Deinococcus betulae]MBZ9749835.1 cobyrinate a,c-diamide synthase [Deinococcus betulae]